MPPRIIRIVLSALLIPALTGISTSCAPMGQAGSADSYAARAESHCDAAAAQDRSGTTQKHQHSQRQRPNPNPTSTNCCPAVAGCAAVALPAIVASLQPATPIVASAHAAYADLPIALAVAPEPPPPKV